MGVSQKKGWRQANAPYIIAATLAVIMFMLVAPEVNEGDVMSPTIRDGDFLVVSKTSYSAKRGVPEDNLIARVAGLPGEHVEVRDNKVMIGGREYITENGIKGGTGDINVKLTKDEVFLLCDNRDESADSRNSKLGAVDMKDIKGNVLLRIWPLSGFGGID